MPTELDYLTMIIDTQIIRTNTALNLITRASLPTEDTDELEHNPDKLPLFIWILGNMHSIDIDQYEKLRQQHLQLTFCIEQINQSLTELYAELKQRLTKEINSTEGDEKQ